MSRVSCKSSIFFSVDLLGGVQVVKKRERARREMEREGEGEEEEEVGVIVVVKVISRCSSRLYKVVIAVGSRYIGRYFRELFCATRRTILTNDYRVVPFIGF